MSDITFNCPGCNGALEVDESAAGRLVNCSHCKMQIKIPFKTPAEPAAVPVSASHPAYAKQDQKACPFCGEMILTIAKKCRYCKNFLDEGECRAKNAGTSGNETPSKFAATSKETARDAVLAVKMLLRDPANGQVDAIKAMGDSRALNSGLALGAAFVAAVWWLLAKGGSHPFSEHIKIVIGSGIPFVAVALALIIINAIFRTGINWKHIVFTAGVALLPAALGIAVSSFLGFANIEIMVAADLFCITTMIMMLNAALTTVLKISSRLALVLIPIVIISSLYICKVIYVAMLQDEINAMKGFFL